MKFEVFNKKICTLKIKGLPLHSKTNKIFIVKV